MNVLAEQASIKSWFDETYKKKKFKYLRSQNAYELFPTLLQVQSGEKHLDVACGLGLMMRSMIDRGLESYGVDLSDEAVRQGKLYCPDGNLQVGNAEALSFDDETFDHITCLGSLERILNRPKAIKEQVRVGKKHAKYCFMVRNSEHFIWRFFLKPLGLDNKKGHQDALNLEQWKALFESCGLKTNKVYRDHWPFYRSISFIWPFKIDYSKERRFFLPLRWTYEYIFVLEKAEPNG